MFLALILSFLLPVANAMTTEQSQLLSSEWKEFQLTHVERPSRRSLTRFLQNSSVIQELVARQEAVSWDEINPILLSSSGNTVTQELAIDFSDGDFELALIPIQMELEIGRANEHRFL